MGHEPTLVMLNRPGRVIPGLRSTDLRLALNVDPIHILVRLSQVHPNQALRLGIVATWMPFAELTMVSLTSAHCEAWTSISLQTELRTGPRPVVQGVPTLYMVIRGCGPLGVRGAVDGPSG